MAQINDFINLRNKRNLFIRETIFQSHELISSSKTE